MFMLQLVIMKFSVRLTFPKESVSLHGTVIGLAPLKKKKTVVVLPVIYGSG